MTAIQCACYRSHFTVAKTLIEIGGANLYHDNEKWLNCPLLIQASAENRLDIVRFLVENGYSDVNKSWSNDEDQCTAMILAASKGYTTLIEYLIEKNADVNYTCKSNRLRGSTPITIAVAQGHIDVVRLLYDADADTNVKLNDGKTLLMVAVRKKRFDVIDFFVKRSIVTIENLELAACSLVVTNSPMRHLHRAAKLLVLAIEYWTSSQTPKVCIKPNVAYEYHQECQTVEELEAIKHDHDRMWIETALVRERLLLSRNDHNLMKPLLDHGDVLVSKGEFDKCLHLWIHAFNLYQKMQIDTCLHRFVWLFCKMFTANQQIPIDQFLKRRNKDKLDLEIFHSMIYTKSNEN
ncbi:unnamed protein product [Rotaria sp. Silwood1]|nr:unnamed protein product [Rotaria sp. Silwood1]CAF1354118.1 unnamed protein product [Rotaria sp. Silwood1]